VSVYPQVQLSVVLKPRVVYTSPVVIYDSDPNIALGTSEPTTPTLSISITSLPQIVGDVKRARYLAAVAANFFNNTGITETSDVFMRFASGGKSILASFYSNSGYFVTLYAVLGNIDTSKTLDIYAWGVHAGWSLRRTIVALIAMPELTDKVVNMVAVRVDGYTIPESVAYANRVANNIVIANADVPETSIDGVGSAIVRGNLIMPTIMTTDRVLDSGGQSSGLYRSVTFLYPSIIAWAE
jgi:hypothetical protein